MTETHFLFSANDSYRFIKTTLTTKERCGKLQSFLLLLRPSSDIIDFPHL